MLNNNYAVETFSLTKVFSDLWGRDKVYAVNELNLNVRYNEVFGLLGPNGSGKTTTLKMLLGLLYPTRGKALVLGGDSTNPKISARIGFLPEESYLYRYLTARETLDFYGRLFSLPSQVRKVRTEELLDMVGLKAVANRPVGTFSKGMARRIGLAQALINDPDLLILDEPTTGLDPIGTRQIKDLILQLAKRGKTVLLCSHLLADVEDVCDRIAILYGGHIQAEGDVKDLLQQTHKTQIIAESLSDNVLAEIKKYIQGKHVDCEITAPMEKLEAFFIRTVFEAEKQARPTSGALSSTQIGEFLAAKSTQERVLDKLVSASVSDEPPKAAPETRKPTPVETGGAEPDKTVLSELTDGPSRPHTEPVDKTESGEPEPKTKEETDEDLLSRLTEPPTEKDQQDKTSESKTEGDQGHA